MTHVLTYHLILLARAVRLLIAAGLGLAANLAPAAEQHKFAAALPPAAPSALDGCGPDMSQYGESKPIPGDPDNLKGWFHRSQVDDQGNVIEVWCLELEGGVGNSFGYRYIPKGGTPKWFARCAFVGGVNSPGKESTGDANKNGVPDGWRLLKHTTEDDSGGGATDPDDDDNTVGKADYDWEYDVATDRLRRWETNNGTRLRPNNPDYDGPAPPKFSDLFAVAPPANPDQQDARMLDEPLLEVLLVSRDDDLWNFGIRGNDLTEFSPVIVAPGDQWSLAAGGVLNAVAPVSWTVAFSSSYVTWAYAGPAAFELSALDGLSGFGIQSSAPEVALFWLSDSADEQGGSFGYAGSVQGPGYRSYLPSIVDGTP
jgi:hypothetical protein